MDRCTTGSAGHALALEFAAQGMRVIATARSLKSLAGLEEKGIEVLTLDVTSIESIAALKAEIQTRTGGKLDVLFNNAGLSKDDEFAVPAELLLTLPSVRGACHRSRSYARPPDVRRQRVWRLRHGVRVHTTSSGRRL